MIRIAIAEDDFRVAEIHQGFLSKISDVQFVGKALNAEETFSLLENNRVDLLLLDIYMPDTLGIHLLPDIRKRFPQVDIIMITAATNRDFLETAIRNGVFNYLIKPVSLTKFKEVIEAYKQHRKNFNTNEEEVDQSFIDHYFGLQKVSESYDERASFPKGISALTLEKVKILLKELENGVTAEELGESLGASRTTARRYLEYLVSIGEGKAELEYGIIGRPERKYYII